ncbi:hypothetical protein N8500_07555 [Candidatus Puniceispirillum sp.]|nr:hypothetical protein [Candidatus Puniceispirillum sp.]
MTKPEFFEHIDTIEMRIRGAEQQIQSWAGTESLLITLSLITIARGTCLMVINPNDSEISPNGQLHIPLNRNVIEASVEIPRRHFDKLIKQIARTAERAGTAKMILNTTLVLDSNGCLIIEEPTDASITSLNWSLTLK